MKLKKLKSDYLLKECKMDICTVTTVIARHYRLEIQEEADNNNNNDDSIYPFYIDCFDRLHHHIFHLDKIGMRVSISNDDQGDVDEDIKKEQKESEDEIATDAAFKKMKEMIFTQRDQFRSNRSIKRYESNNNKFNLVINNNDNNEYKSGLSLLHIISLMQLKFTVLTLL